MSRRTQTRAHPGPCNPRLRFSIGIRLRHGGKDWPTISVVSTATKFEAYEVRAIPKSGIETIFKGFLNTTQLSVTSNWYHFNETIDSSFGQNLSKLTPLPSLKQILSKECGLVLPRKRRYGLGALYAGTFEFPSFVGLGPATYVMLFISCYVMSLSLSLSCHVHLQICILARLDQGNVGNIAGSTCLILLPG